MGTYTQENGEGKCVYADGDVYEGGWKDGTSMERVNISTPTVMNTKEIRGLAETSETLTQHR